MSSRLFFYLAIIIAAPSRAEPLSGDVSRPSLMEYRFIVSIARKFNRTDDNPYGHVCGGASISGINVLTAASCFQAGLPENNYFVYAGRADLSQSMVVGIKEVIKFDDWYETRVKCQKMLLHRKYETNDIAVVKLQKRTPFSVSKVNIWNISPELLPLELAAKNWTIQTAGWSKFLDGTPPQYMLKSDLQLVNRDMCALDIKIESYDPSYTLGANIFCTKGNGYFTVLNAGDKGSPVFVKQQSWGDYRIVGINLKSLPETDDRTRYPNQRNTHISLYCYMKFIISATGLKSFSAPPTDCY